MAKHTLGTIPFVVPLIALLALSVGAADLGTFRPPAVPLVTVDPYTSVWSFSDHLYDSWPVHWTGQPHAMAGMIRVDGKTYRFMGPDVVCPEAAEQTSLAVKPTRTLHAFKAVWSCAWRSSHRCCRPTSSC